MEKKQPPIGKLQSFKNGKERRDHLERINELHGREREKEIRDELHKIYLAEHDKKNKES
jgi:hypothetical protein